MFISNDLRTGQFSVHEIFFTVSYSNTILLDV